MTEIASLEEKAMNLDSKGTSAVEGKMSAGEIQSDRATMTMNRVDGWCRHNGRVS